MSLSHGFWQRALDADVLEMQLNHPLWQRAVYWGRQAPCSGRACFIILLLSVNMELVRRACHLQQSTASLLASWEAKGTVVCQLRVGGQCWAFWAGVAPLCFEVPVDDAAGMLLHEHVPRQMPWTVALIY